jgi:hypothetical protein
MIRNWEKMIWLWIFKLVSSSFKPTATNITNKLIMSMFLQIVAQLVMKSPGFTKSYFPYA